METNQPSGPDISPKKQRRLEQMKSLCAGVRALYDQGAPLFTKRGIQDLYLQLERLKRGTDDHQLHITGIDGVAVDVLIKKKMGTQWVDEVTN